MDELVSKLAFTSLEVIGKAAFGTAASLAIRRLNDRLTVGAAQGQGQGPGRGSESSAAMLKAELEDELATATPLIDWLQLQQPRVQPQSVLGLQLAALLRMTARFQRRLEKLPHAQSSPLSASPPQSRRASSAETESLIGELLASLRALLPYVHLTVSSLPLLQAQSQLRFSSLSALLRAGHLRGAGATLRLRVRLYTLFTGSVRKNGRNWTWKEELPDADLSLEASPLTHAVLQVRDRGGAEQLEIPVASITKTCYTDDAALLGLRTSTADKDENENVQLERPHRVLVFKTTGAQRSRDRWYALQLVRPGEDTGNESGSGSERSRSSSSATRSVASFGTARTEARRPAGRGRREDTNSSIGDDTNDPLRTLEVLDYLIRIHAAEHAASPAGPRDAETPTPYYMLDEDALRRAFQQ